MKLRLCTAAITLAFATACSTSAEDSTPAIDADGDGFTTVDDCDDADDAIHPDADELCGDDIDSDCSGEINDNPSDGKLYYADVDGDGFGDETTEVAACKDDKPADHVKNGDDCDDDDKDINPDASEFCDTVDNNCDGDTDENDAVDAGIWYADSDDDGYGDGESTTAACNQPSGYSDDDTDCDDDDEDVFPEADEYCDDVDNNCDGYVDEADAVDAIEWYADDDYDGFGDALEVLLACDKPYYYVDDSSDCDDDDGKSYPGAPELCDGVDNDCDSTIDGAACSGFEGSYSGDYSHLTEEKVGTYVVNSVSCSGEGSITIDLSADPVVQGSFDCTYTGSLGGFQSGQSMILEADLALDGTIDGSIEHKYDYSSSRTYSIDGDVNKDDITLDGTGSWYPSTYSTVAWQTSFDVAATAD
jgi:hypothetical protein